MLHSVQPQINGIMSKGGSCLSCKCNANNKKIQAFMPNLLKYEPIYNV